jgi:hypothetical protein
VLLHDLNARHKLGDFDVVMRVPWKQQFSRQINFRRLLIEVRQKSALFFDEERP